MTRRFDLTPLDPMGDARRWEQLVGRILTDAAPMLERRATPAGPLLAVTDFFRPALGVAFACAMISAVVLFQETERAGLLATIPEELGLPAPVAEWLAYGGEIATDDLLASLDLETP